MKGSWHHGTIRISRPSDARLLTLAAVLTCSAWSCGPALDHRAAGTAAPSLSGTYAGPIIDFHTHILFDPQFRPELKRPPSTPEALQHELLLAGVSRAGVIVIAEKGKLEETRRKNDAVIQLARRSAGRLFAIGSVHPEDDGDAIAELERISAAGARGVKLHPNTQHFDVAAPKVSTIVARAAKLGLFVLFDGWSPFDANQVGKFVMLAVNRPEACLVLAHMGGATFHDMLVFAFLRRYRWYTDNVWFDLSATAAFYARSPVAEQLLWTIRRIGVDRMLFGSDFPEHTPREAVAAVRSLGLTPEESRLIFHDNAARLLGHD
jgi:uncharacterized protein